MMKKFLLLVFVFILTAGAAGTFSQEVKPLAAKKDMDELMEANKGKVVLINFWATWCKPCVHEFPDLVKLYNNYKDKGFVIVFISVDVPDDVDSKVIPFLKNQNVDFTTYFNNFDKPEELINYIDKDWEGAIPSTYIYDKEGNLTADFLGSRSYEEFEKAVQKNLD